MMFTPIEWMVFACVAFGFLAVGVVWQLAQAGGQTSADGKSIGLQWRPELERVPSFGTAQAQNTQQWDAWLHRVIAQADVGLTLPTFLLAAGCAALLTGIGVRLLELAEAFQILAGVTVFAVCVLTLWLRFRQQRKKFNEQFPVALELMARAVQAGESFENAVGVARDSSQSPLQGELERCVNQMRLGVAPTMAMDGLVQRVPTMDVRIFAHTIAVHHEMGGRLAMTLDRLASVIRERSEYTERLRSATSLGRFAAIMISVIGLAALTYLLICQPGYLGRLLESPLGQRMAIYAAVSEVVGIVWVFVTLNAEM